MLKQTLLATSLAFAFAAPVHAQDVDTSNLSVAIGSAQATGLDEQLTASEGLTVFVPTNDALTSLPTEALAGVRGDPDKLRQVITYYAVEGKVMAKDIMEQAKDGEATLDTLSGGKLTVMMDGDKVKVKGGTGEATVTQTDLQVGNIVIHVIDGALLPEGVTADAESQ